MSRSKLDHILEELPDTEASLLQEALEDPGVENTELAAILTRHGHSITEASVRRWRSRA